MNENIIKTSIYVFSGTGTSLAIAKKIGNYLGNTSIISITNALENANENEIKVESSKIGFIFPNYFGGIPNIVLKFIERLNLENVNYIFSVVTAGGDQGYSLKFLKKELEKKGGKLDYGKCVAGLSNYIVGWYYSAICKQTAQRENTIRLIDDKVRKIAKDIVCEKSAVDKNQYFSYKLSHLISPKKVIKDTRPWDKEFKADDKCNGCGICQKVCQVKNIKMNDHKPDFQHNCQRCMACIQYCPNNAIRHNGKILNKPKYFHPEVPAKEMINFINKN